MATSFISNVGITHDIEYLRMVANVDPAWQVVVDCLPLCHQRSAALEYTLKTKRALIYLNTEYVFTAASAARAITHELFELSLAELWSATVAITGDQASIRTARDQYIERRLRALPFWDVTDLPILRKELDKLCPSFPSKVLTNTANRPKFRYCTNISQPCHCQLPR